MVDSATVSQSHLLDSISGAGTDDAAMKRQLAEELRADAGTEII